MGRYARELILEGLQEPDRLLEKKKFWKKTVFDEYLAEVTNLINDDEPRALDLARLGPSFAALVAAERDLDPNILTLRALNLLGSANIAVDCFQDSDAAFDKADALDAPATEHADTDRRRGLLRVHQGRPQEGHTFTNRAVQIYSSTGELFDRQHLGLAFSARGFAHYHAARLGPSAVDLSAAGGLINFRKSPRAYYDVLHNLTVVMVEVMDPEKLGQTLRNLEACYRRLVGSKHKMARLKLRWVQGLAQKRFGCTRQAEKFLKLAFNGFVDHGAPSEVAMISLDIALLFIEEHRFDEAMKLSLDAYKIVRVLGIESGGLAALQVWTDATRTQLTSELLAGIRKDFLHHAKPYGLS